MKTIISSNIEQLLEHERNFTFHKKDVPKKLHTLLNEIENNKRKWKSLYMAVWGLPLYFLEPRYINKTRGDEVIPWGLPEAKHKKVLYTPNELKKYLTSYDKEIHISQLIKIFTLIENYFFEYYDLNKNGLSLKQKGFKYILNSWIVRIYMKKNSKRRSKIDKAKQKLKIQKKDFTSFQVLKNYLKYNNFAKDTELLELEYAKETRNSFVHRRGLVNKSWLKIHKKTGRNKNILINDSIPLKFHDLEDWTDILIKVIERSIRKDHTK